MERPLMKIVQPWSLYGYGLAQYVVETNIGEPIGGADYVGAQFAWLEMCEFGCSQHT
jgi:hypothetical protein